MTDKSEITLNTDPVVPETEAVVEGAESTETTFGGFKTVGELTAAYEALKTPVSTEVTEPVVPETEAPAEKDSKEIPLGDEGAKETVQNAGLDWDGLNTEYADNGKLSDETYATLEAAGLPRSEVDTYIQGKQAQADAYDNAVYGAVGGTEEYGSLVEWASSALNQTEKVAFNAAVQSGDAERAKMAVEALMGRRAKTQGTPPNNLLKGKKQASGVQPFASQAEVTEAMKSKAYKTDPAFRAQVVERLRDSSF